MQTLDYIVLTLYMAGVFGVGVLFATRNKSSADMFAAGGKSPWWASGLSAFMTMFSANTFVVWGGIAYRLGFVAVLINLMYGVAALLVGYFVAGRWKNLGVQTPAAFIQLRFGSGALHFFTWFMTVFKMVTTAGALYALGRILVGLMPLADGNPLQDPETGNLSLFWGIIIFSSIVVVYTMIGGLWAVLMTDVLQFIVLNLAVLFVIPLVLLQAGGFGEFWSAAGQTVVDDSGRSMLAPIAGSYSFLFLVGWCLIHFFMIGAEWAFVQRFICVEDAKAARKSTYLFGCLYLVSPVLWLLPPLVWRVVSPIPDDATDDVVLRLQETAYIEACRTVLPVGMVGLMVAAMFSATASMVSSQLNVFSGVFTQDIVRPLAGWREDDRRMLNLGRVFTVVLGALLIGIALSYRYLGGAEKVIIGVTELVVVALFAPTIWGLFSRSVTTSAVWVTAAVSITAGLLVRYGLVEDGFLAGAMPALTQWVSEHGTATKTLTGVVLPILVMVAMQLISKGTATGYERVAALAPPDPVSGRGGAGAGGRLPGYVVSGALGACGFMMIVLIAFNPAEDRLVLTVFGAVLLLLSAAIAWLTARMSVDESAVEGNVYDVET